MYKMDLRLYSNNGVEVMVTPDEYRQCVEVQKKINRLFKKYSDPDQEISFFDWDADDEIQTVSRIEWTVLTRKWIESLKMYDPNVNYIQ